MALVAGAPPGVPHLGQIKSQHLPIPDFRGPLFIFVTGPINHSLTNIGYAKTIYNFSTDGRIFDIFFFKQLRILPPLQ